MNRPRIKQFLAFRGGIRKFRTRLGRKNRESEENANAGGSEEKGKNFVALIPRGAHYRYYSTNINAFGR